MAIQSFKDKGTAAFFAGGFVKQWQKIEKSADRKMAVLDAAATLQDLADVPGNRLEKLSGERKDQHSIRINDQWRICFEWTDEGPIHVEIVDYH
jgi:proteic killer suppression protein